MLTSIISDSFQSPLGLNCFGCLNESHTQMLNRRTCQLWTPYYSWSFGAIIVCHMRSCGDSCSSKFKNSYLLMDDLGNFTQYIQVGLQNAALHTDFSLLILLTPLCLKCSCMMSATTVSTNFCHATVEDVPNESGKLWSLNLHYNFLMYWSQACLWLCLPCQNLSSWRVLWIMRAKAQSVCILLLSQHIHAEPFNRYKCIFCAVTIIWYLVKCTRCVDLLLVGITFSYILLFFLLFDCIWWVDYHFFGIVFMVDHCWYAGQLACNRLY